MPEQTMKNKAQGYISSKCITGKDKHWAPSYSVNVAAGFPSLKPKQFPCFQCNPILIPKHKQLPFKKKQTAKKQTQKSHFL